MYPSVDRDTKTTQIYHALNLQMTNILVSHPHTTLSAVSFKLSDRASTDSDISPVSHNTVHRNTILTSRLARHWPALPSIRLIFWDNSVAVMSSPPSPSMDTSNCIYRNGNETLPRLKFHNQTITITETRDFSGLKVPTNAFTFKILIRHYSKPIVNRSEFGMLTQRL